MPQLCPKPRRVVYVEEIDFTIESPRQCRDRLAAYTQGLPPDFPYTRGAYRRKLL